MLTIIMVWPKTIQINMMMRREKNLKMIGGSILELLIDVITELLKDILKGIDNRTISNDSMIATTTGYNSLNISATGRIFLKLSAANSNTDLSDSNNTNGSADALLLQYLYDQTSNRACRIFHNYGVSPLNPCRINRFLDQIASIAVSSPSPS